ncbi:MAG: DUF2779 domain-containing protein [Nanoarchaeota archaeon]
MTLLTKSKYMSGTQCQKLLFFIKENLLPEPTLADQHKFNQGAIFEQQAHKLFTNTKTIQTEDFLKNIQESKEALLTKKTLFEAGFTIDDLYIRTDVLEPNNNGFNLYEIKSSNDTKPEHIEDLAFQKYVLEKKGIKIKKYSVIHANKEYTKKGEIDPKKLCTTDDVTEDVNKVKGMDEAARRSKRTLLLQKAPDVPIGKHCNSPYACPFKDKCWDYLPKNNIFSLSSWRTYWKLFDDNILDIKDIPDETKLTDKDQVIREAALNNKPYIAKEHIKNFIKRLHYPLYHFDFETFQTAVPLFDNSRPWQQIPFQYSIHIEHKNKTVEHKEFLSDSKTDPRPALLKQLKGDLHGEGDIIVFNKSFEITRLKEMTNDFPEHEPWINDVIARIVDLAVPFKNCYYYHPEMQGSYSLKKVLPALTKGSYDNLAINNGGDASAQFFYSHIKPELKNKEEIRKDLFRYCALDTEGMIWILDSLEKMVDMD